MQDNTRIHTLIAFSNKLTDASMPPLAKLLLVNRTISVVDLGRNEVSAA